MITPFNGFINKYGLQNKATSNIELQQVLKLLVFDSKKTFYSRDGNFSTNSGILNLFTPVNERMGFVTMEILVLIPMEFLHLKNPNYMESVHGKCIYSENQIQKNGSLCGSYVL